MDLKFFKRYVYPDEFQIKELEIINRFLKDADEDIYVFVYVTQPFTKPESIKKP